MVFVVLDIYLITFYVDINSIFLWCDVVLSIPEFVASRCQGQHYTDILIQAKKEILSASARRPMRIIFEQNHRKDFSSILLF